MAMSKPLFGTPLNEAHPLSQGLVGCWLFNEGSGTTVYDSSGNSETGAIIIEPGAGTYGWVSGQTGSAYLFNGSVSVLNNIVLVTNANALAITGSLSIVARINPAVIQSGNFICTKFDSAGNNGYMWEIDTLGKLRAGLIGSNGSWYGSPSSNTIIPINTWSQIAWTYNINGTLNSLYYNGVFDKSGAELTGTPSAAQGHLQMMCSNGYQNVGYQGLNGLMSELMIWNRVLAPQEISYLNAFPFAMFDTNTYNQFDPSSSNTLIVGGSLL